MPPLPLCQHTLAVQRDLKMLLRVLETGSSLDRKFGVFSKGSKQMYCGKPERILSSVFGEYGWLAAFLSSVMNVYNHVLVIGYFEQVAWESLFKVLVMILLQAVKVFRAHFVFRSVFLENFLLGTTFSIFLPI